MKLLNIHKVTNNNDKKKKYVQVVDWSWTFFVVVLNDRFRLQ